MTRSIAAAIPATTVAAAHDATAVPLAVRAVQPVFLRQPVPGNFPYHERDNQKRDHRVGNPFHSLQPFHQMRSAPPSRTNRAAP